MSLGKAKVKVALSLSLRVRRFCAKSSNVENNPRTAVHAPTLRGRVLGLLASRVFSHTCCRAQAAPSPSLRVSTGDCVA